MFGVLESFFMKYKKPPIQLLYGFYPWGKQKRTLAGLLTEILTAPLTFPEENSVSPEMK